MASAYSLQLAVNCEIVEADACVKHSVLHCYQWQVFSALILPLINMNSKKKELTERACNL